MEYLWWISAQRALCFAQWRMSETHGDSITSSMRGAVWKLLAYLIYLIMFGLIAPLALHQVTLFVLQ